MDKARKCIIIILSIILAIVALGLIAYPFIEIDTGEKLIVCSYSDDISEFEENASYNELYFYNEERDISIKDFDFKKFLFFHVIELGYIKGDARETQFILDEAYINDWLENAVITDNSNNIDLKKLIEGKTAIVGNKRYLGNDYENAIFFKLNGKEEEMYIFYVDDLLVIQVGSPDESPKYIAYKE